jgi:hypothetical protein
VRVVSVTNWRRDFVLDMNGLLEAIVDEGFLDLIVLSRS